MRMRIGELARHAGVSTSQLRYYEERGLLGPAKRTESGYRVYGPDAPRRLGFILRAKALGLSLGEIRTLIRGSTDPRSDQARLRHIIAHKLADTRHKIDELELLQHDLEALYLRLDRSASPCGHIGDCECWLPTEEEVNRMMAEVHEATCCDCDCDCTADETCNCCDC